MRKYFNIKTIFVTAAVALTACSTEIQVPQAPKIKVPEFKIPDIKFPDLAGISEPKCKKDEKDQKFSNEAKQNILSAEIQVDTEYQESIDCNGKVSVVKAAAGLAIKNIEVPPPTSIDGKTVKYIEVENPRTCTEFKVETEDTPTPTIFAVAAKDGAATIPVTNSVLLGKQVVALEGLNVVTLRYYNDASEKIASRDITLAVKFNVVATPGKDRMTNTCDKK